MATNTADPEAEALDAEIVALKEQVASLQRQLRVQSSTILSSALAQPLLRPSSSSALAPSRSRRLDRAAQQQRAHTQRCVHRIANSVTASKVRDPDPNAVDAGHVLGLRFEIMSRGQFLKPYYAMLNRPFAASSHLRVHRHTLPPAVPLAGLAARHLPEPRPEGGVDSPPQDLERFVRALRREIMRYHNRLGVSADLRRGLGLQDKGRRSRAAHGIVDVGIADIEAKQIKLTWADERSGRLVMDDDGRVVKLVVFGGQGRDWETTKELFGNYDRIEDVAKKLLEYSAG